MAGISVLALVPMTAHVAAAADARYTRVALSVSISGQSVRATGTVKASRSVPVNAYGVCVRSADGQKLDYAKKRGVITTTGTTLVTGWKRFAPGTYRYFTCVNDGRWHNVGAAKTFTVKATSTATTQPYTQLALSASVSGSTVTATATVSSDVSRSVANYGVCVRSASGANLDFAKRPATITSSGTRYLSDMRSFPNGTYSYWPCVYDGRWHDVGLKRTFVVGSSTPPPSSPPPSSPPPSGTQRYTQLALSASVSASTVTTTATVSSDVSRSVSHYGVCVRSASGAGLDFVKRAATITPSGTSYVSDVKSFPTGTYTYWPCVFDGGWHDVGLKRTFVVGSVSSPPPSTVPPSSPPPSTVPPSSPPPANVPHGPSGSWQAIFSDEFNGTALDTAKWNTLEGKKMNNVILSSRNVSVTGGNLVIQLSDATYGGAVSSSKLDGWGRSGFEAPVGSYTEARVYFPGNDSQPVFNFPAAWTSGHSWPSNGEHDYAEGLSGRLTANYHYGANWDNHVANNSGPIAGTWHNAFHTYGVHRKAHSADVYWDGKLIRSYSTSDAGGPHTILFNVGKSNTRAVVTGAAGALKVDYVRVWRPAT